MSHNTISIALDTSPGDSALRQGTEDLAIELGATLSAIGRAALSAAISDPSLIESRISRRSSGRRIGRK